MQWQRAISVQPTKEPISVTEAALHTKVDDVGAEQSWLELEVAAARIRCEELSGTATTTRTCTLTMDEFPADREPIHLPWPPLASVTSIAYYDEDGDLQAYDVGTLQITGTGSSRQCSTLHPPVDDEWPETEAENSTAIVITFVAGTVAASVNALLRAGMLLDIGAKYVHREDIEMSPSGRAISLLPESSKNIYRNHLQAIWKGPTQAG